VLLAACAFLGTSSSAWALHPICSLTCPSDITLPNDPNQCGAIVNYPLPTTNDSSCSNITCTTESGAFFPVGDDVGGPVRNLLTPVRFHVTVEDAEAPTITCPDDSTETSDPTTVSYSPPSVSDNCPGVTATCTPPSGSEYPQGATETSCEATDAADNASQCQFLVTLDPVPSSGGTAGGTSGETTGETPVTDPSSGGCSLVRSR
jgi:hypothetical protein